MIAFFEERRGRLYGFRWRDRLDHSSTTPGAPPTPIDQVIGSGDGMTATFALGRSYGGAHAPNLRPIAKPMPGSVRVAVAGVEVAEDTAFTCDTTTGLVTFLPAHVPAAGQAVTALAVRRAGALRRRLSRSRLLGLRGRRDSQDPGGGDQGVMMVGRRARCA